MNREYQERNLMHQFEARLREIHSAGGVGYFESPDKSKTGIILANWQDKKNGLTTEIRIDGEDRDGVRITSSNFKSSLEQGSDPRITVLYQGKIEPKKAISTVLESRPLREATEQTRMIFNPTTPITKAVEGYKSLRKNNPFLASLLPIVLNREVPHEQVLFNHLAPLAGIMV